MNGNVLPLLLLLMGSVISLTFGVLVRIGGVRYWWAVPYYAAGQEPFVSLPIGLFLLFTFIGVLSPARLKLFFVSIAIGCGLSVLIFLAVQPRFLKPEWLQWLEDNHKEHVPLLRREARQMGAFQWARRVKTQAGLEQWVGEVLHKHGLN
jgi:hypothetical protein